MEPKAFLERIDSYVAQLRGILSRFQKGRDTLHIHREDEAKLQQLAVELRDMFNDALGPNDYGAMVVDAFNNGTSNFLGSSSYASVEQIISIVSAARTRVADNPRLLSQTTGATQSSVRRPPLAAPPQVTLSWLFNNVPYKFWLIAGGVIIASFVAGVTAAAKLQVVQQWFGLVCGK